MGQSSEYDENICCEDVTLSSKAVISHKTEHSRYKVRRLIWVGSNTNSFISLFVCSEELYVYYVIRLCGMCRRYYNFIIFYVLQNSLSSPHGLDCSEDLMHYLSSTFFFLHLQSFSIKAINGVIPVYPFNQRPFFGAGELCLSTLISIGISAN